MEIFSLFSHSYKLCTIFYTRCYIVAHALGLARFTLGRVHALDKLSFIQCAILCQQICQTLTLTTKTIKIGIKNKLELNIFQLNLPKELYFILKNEHLKYLLLFGSLFFATEITFIKSRALQ